MKKKTVAIEITTIDQWSVMTDEERFQRNKELQSALWSAKRIGANTKNIEIELAYAERENQMRKVRADLHSAWLKENSNIIDEEYRTKATDDIQIEDYEN